MANFDIILDTLLRLQNAGNVNKASTQVMKSTMVKAVLQKLQERGFINSFNEEANAMAEDLGVDVVAGAETAGIPLSAAIGLKAELPMIYVRKRPKSYGTMSFVEGILEKDQKVVLITTCSSLVINNKGILSIGITSIASIQNRTRAVVPTEN